MKARTFITAIGMLALLSACATTPSAERQPPLKVVDQTYVNAVERQAARLGTRVYWVNPPERRRPDEKRDDA